MENFTPRQVLARGLDRDKYRRLFPHIGEHIYLNHAALSPMHARAMRAVENNFQQRAVTNIEFWPDLVEVKARFKNNVGRLINGASENISISSSTSMALNWLARGLRWQPGDRILLNDFEFPTNVYPFLNLRHQGVEIDFVQHRNGKIELADIAAAIRPETRLLSISYVQFLNGFRADLAAISQLCRENNLIFCVDGIQGLGALTIDVEALQIDFLACGGQKWLMWPLGTAFFYTSPRIFNQIRPMAAGWLAVENSWDFFDYQLDFLPSGERFEPGMFNVAGVVGANASLEMFLEIGPKNIEKAVLQLTDYLIAQLQFAGFEIITPLEPAMRSGIVTFRHTAAEALFAFLCANKLHVSLRDGLIRVAPHFYNTEAEIDHLISMIKQFDK